MEKRQHNKALEQIKGYGKSFHKFMKSGRINKVIKLAIA